MYEARSKTKNNAKISSQLVMESSYIQRHCHGNWKIFLARFSFLFRLIFVFNIVKETEKSAEMVWLVDNHKRRDQSKLEKKNNNNNTWWVQHKTWLA